MKYKLIKRKTKIKTNIKQQIVTQYKTTLCLPSPTWLKNSINKQSNQGIATSIGRASLDMSETFINIIII
jgi:hypothetical protein